MERGWIRNPKPATAQRHNELLSPEAPKLADNHLTHGAQLFRQDLLGHAQRNGVTPAGGGP